MPDRAHVTSVDAIESFRANLILYVSKARPTLEEVGADVTRTRLWLQNEQRIHWESEVRRRTRELEQAQQALSRVRMSSLNQSSIVEQKAAQKARRLLDEAEAKLKRVKQWSRDFDSRVEPLVKQLEKLHTVLSNDMLKAAAALTQTIKTLDAYTAATPPSSSVTATPPGSPSLPDGATTANRGGEEVGGRPGNPDAAAERHP